MGPNPFAHFGTLGYGRGKLEFLVVQEMFLTDTAKVADVVFPAASAYEKDGTVTNTSGEIQLLRKGAEVMGTRTDFDLLRILSHQLERVGLGKAFHYKTPAAVFEEIRKAVPGYNVDVTPLLTGSAEPTHVHVARNGHAPYDVPAGLIIGGVAVSGDMRSEEHTSELQSRQYLVCRLLLEKKKKN